MQIWVAGSTGLVGKSLVELLARRAPGRTRGRTGPTAALGPTPKARGALLVDFEQLGPSLTGRPVSHAACCPGTTLAKAKARDAFRRVGFDYPLALAQAAHVGGAHTFLLVSALGADPKSSVFYSRVKGELELALAELDFPTLHILRPSLLLGERKEPRFGEQVASAVGLPSGDCLFGPLRKFAPIPALDVARALVGLSLEPEARPGPGERRFVHESDAISRLSKARPNES